MRRHLARILLIVLVGAAGLPLVGGTAAASRYDEIWWDKDIEPAASHLESGTERPDSATVLSFADYLGSERRARVAAGLTAKVNAENEAWSYVRHRFRAPTADAVLHLDAEWNAFVVHALGFGNSTKFTIDLRVIELDLREGRNDTVATIFHKRLVSDGADAGGIDVLVPMKIQGSVDESYRLELKPRTYYWVELEVRCRVQIDVISLSGTACDAATGSASAPPGLTINDLELEFDIGRCPIWDTRDGCVHETRAGQCGVDGYWLIEDDGDTYQFGDADDHGEPDVTGGTVDIEATPTGCGYWALLDDGTVTAHGDAFGVLSVDSDIVDEMQSNGERFASMSPTRSGNGMWVFTSAGRVITLGDARPRQSEGGLTDLLTVDLQGEIVDSIATPDGGGYYMLGSDGGVFTFGNATFRGSIQSVVDDVAPGTAANDWLAAPIVGLVPDPDGNGYWLVAADGGVFTFEAPFRGSAPGVLNGAPLAQPITGMVPYGDGYLQVAEDGGVFNFSSKAFLGSLGENPPNRPIRAISPMLRPGTEIEPDPGIVIDPGIGICQGNCDIIGGPGDNTDVDIEL